MSDQPKKLRSLFDDEFSPTHKPADSTVPLVSSDSIAEATSSMRSAATRGVERAQASVRAAHERGAALLDHARQKSRSGKEAGVVERLNSLRLTVALAWGAGALLVLLLVLAAALWRKNQELAAEVDARPGEQAQFEAELAKHESKVKADEVADDAVDVAPVASEVVPTPAPTTPVGVEPNTAHALNALNQTLAEQGEIPSPTPVVAPKEAAPVTKKPTTPVDANPPVTTPRREVRTATPAAPVVRPKSVQPPKVVAAPVAPTVAKTAEPSVTCSVAGRVVDEQGKAIPAAKVAVTGIKSNTESRSLVAGPSGEFASADVARGSRVTVAVRAKGYLDSVTDVSACSGEHVIALKKSNPISALKNLGRRADRKVKEKLGRD